MEIVKRVYPFIIVLGSLACVPQRTTAHEFQIRGECPKWAWGNPMDMLDTAARAHPRIARFRINWSAVLGGSGDEGTILYDRKKGVLKYYDTGGNITGGSVKGGENYNQYHKHYLFTNVSDRILDQFVRDTRHLSHEKVYPFVFLDMLPKYGCGRIIIADFSRNYDIKGSHQADPTPNEPAP